MTNIYPNQLTYGMPYMVVQPTRYGTSVPAQWCDTHGIVVADDDLRVNHYGDEWCYAAEDDQDQRTCRLLPLVVGS